MAILGRSELSSTEQDKNSVDHLFETFKELKESSDKLSIARTEHLDRIANLNKDALTNPANNLWFSPSGTPIPMPEEMKAAKAGGQQALIDFKLKQARAVMSAFDPSQTQGGVAQALPDTPGDVSSMAPQATSESSPEQESRLVSSRGIDPKTYLYKPRPTVDAEGNVTPKFDTYEDQQKRADALTSKVRTEHPEIPEYQNIKGTTKAAVDYVEPILKQVEAGKNVDLTAAQPVLESALTQVTMGIQSQVRAGLLDQATGQSLAERFTGLYSKMTSGGKGLSPKTMRTFVEAIKDLHDSHAELYNDTLGGIRRQAKLNGVSPDQIDAAFPKATTYTPSYKSESDALKNAKEGDIVKVNGRRLKVTKS